MSDDSKRLQTSASWAFGVLLFLLCSGFVGCSSRVVRVYQGPELSRDQIALLSSERIFKANTGYTILVERIDGEIPPSRHHLKTLLSGGTAYANEEYEILPGPHTIEVSFKANNPTLGLTTSSTSNARIDFTAQAGRRYKIRMAETTGLGRGLAGAFVAGTVAAFAGGTWTAWIVEADTGHVVGGTPPKK